MVDPEPSPRPPVIAYVAEAHQRVLAAVRGLGDDDMRRPSLLPDWNIAQVLTHLSRNADSHVRRARAAVTGVIVEQYVGGYAGRAAEIDAGAGLAAAAVLSDLRQSCAALEAEWNALPDDAWSRPTLDVAGRERPLSALTWRRWQEVEVHPVDLGIGVTHRDWSDAFVDAWLPLLRPRAAPLAPDTLDGRDELLWLFGRLDGPGLPPVPPWV